MNTLNVYHKIHIWPSKWTLLKCWYIKQTIAFPYKFTACMFSHSVVSDSATPWTAARQVSLSFTISQSYSNSCPLSWWCHLTMSSSVVPFSSCLQSFPASGSFSVSQFFLSGAQSIIGVSAPASVLLVNIQGWFPLGWTGLISFKSKGLSRVFYSTAILKHRFFGFQSSLWSNSHVRTWLLEKLWLCGPLSAK